MLTPYIFDVFEFAVSELLRAACLNETRVENSDSKYTREQRL